MAEEKKHTVLVVDDVSDNIDILSGVLQDSYTVKAAVNGKMALKIASTLDPPPDIILLDVMMPDMDGYEVCSKLKENPNTKDIPVIFVTAMSETSDETKGFELGAVDYITKPISPPVVLSRVSAQLKLQEKTKQLAQLSNKLSKYLSPQVYVSIFRGEQDADIASKRKKLTIYFSDIVGFTSTTEGMETEDLTVLLNNYLDEMSQIAIKHGGTIDKFIGDAILIFFGDPLTRGLQEDATACLDMALEMRKKMSELQKKWYDSGYQNPFQIRAGITTGYCTVGNFGSKSRMDYTIIGGNVNAAARLESSAEPGQIIISHETWSLIKEKIYCIKNKLITVKGISHPIQTYQVVGYTDKLKEKDKVFQIGYMVERSEPVLSTLSIGEVVASSTGWNSNEAVIVTRDDELLGIVTMNTLHNYSGSPEAEIASILDYDPLVVEAGESFDDVLLKVADRHAEKFYDPLVVLKDGVIEGIIPVKNLLLKIAEDKRH